MSSRAILQRFTRDCQVFEKWRLSYGKQQQNFAYQSHFDPRQISQRLAGFVTAVDIEEKIITVESHRGEVETVLFDQNTIFVGPVQSLAEVTVNMSARLGLQEQDGRLVAVIATIRTPLICHAGKITAIDNTASAFALRTFQGETLAFTVDDKTRFYSRDGSVDSFEDLAIGMRVEVSAQQLEDGTYVAVMVRKGRR